MLMRQCFSDLRPALEQSNVNVAKTLVNMIELARQYEMQVNAIKAAEENADAAATMMRVS